MYVRVSEGESVFVCLHVYVLSVFVCLHVDVLSVFVCLHVDVF